VSPDRTRRVGQVSALAALALLASACTGTTPTAGHPRHSNRPSPVQTSQAPTPQPPASSPAPSTSASPTTPVTAAPCPTTQLDVSLAHGGVAAGSTYQRLVFTNTGSATCSLAGFPGVSYVTSRNGTQVGAAADRMGATHTVTLAPGRSVAAVLQSSDARNYAEDRCRQATAGGLRVYPPNQTAAVFVRDRALTCADTSVHVLHVGSVRAG